MRAAIDDEEAFAELERQAKEGGQEFVARFEPGPKISIGDVIDVGVKTEHLHFFDPDDGHALR
jgi:multiple sugar transport system ATP-binding protein